jgi:CHAD domain-containing protein
VAAAKVVGVRGEEVWEHSAGVLDTADLERVHDMRVATRRLRAVLEIFAPCFPRELHGEVLRDVKRLADALGARRDPDVQGQALAAFAAAVPDTERPGVEGLMERIREEQAAGNATLAAALEEAEHSDLRGRVRALAEAAGA